jgi:hypothetical protein
MEMVMGDIVSEIGRFACHFVTNVAGSGQASCYNFSSTTTIGYCIILGLGLLIAFRRIFSQAG